MDYNDFPILSNLDYSIANSKYLESKVFFNNIEMQNICNELHECFNMCCLINHKYGVSFLNTITNIKENIDKILNNFTSTFNIKNSNNTPLKSFNIFICVRKLLSVVKKINIYEQTEKKEYFKLMLKKTNLEILDMLSDLNAIIEKSSGYYFKHF